MRGASSIIAVVVVCLAIGALYWFIGRSQISKQIDSFNNEVEALKTQQAELDRMEAGIPELLAKLPVWQRQYELFRAAIPTKVDDHRFLSAIVDQLGKAGAKFMNSELDMGGQWLEGVSDTQFEQLKTAGLDVDTAKQIKVAYYSLNVSGDYSAILNAFEGLKRYGRLYTIDQVVGPNSQIAGGVMQKTDLSTLPIQMTGRIYFGIPENYFNVKAIQRMFTEKGSGAAARSTANGIKEAGQRIRPRGSRNKGEEAAAAGAVTETVTGSGLSAEAGEAG